MYSILYVDDDEALLGVNKIFLERTGEFKVDIASSAGEALDRIPSAAYDLILSDYQMPGMDGIEFLKAVRSRYGNIPFIIFTGKGREEVVMEALNNGVDFYVQKGPDLKGMIAELKHKINRAIERRRTEEELDRSRQQLNDIISFLPDATFVIDTSRRVIAWNHAMEVLTSVRKADILGKGDYEYAIPFTGKRRCLLIDTVLHDPPSLENRCPLIGNPGVMRSSELFCGNVNDGRGAHLWVRAGPLCGADGTITGAIETIRDMTAFRKIKNDLDISRHMNHIFANMLPVAVYEMDMNGILTGGNDALYALFRFTRETIPSPLHILEYITPSDRDRARTDIIAASQGRGTSRGEEYLLMKADGSTFPALIYGAPVIDPDTSRPRGIRGVIIDQTERREYTRALQESEERLRMALKVGNMAIWSVDMRTMTISDVHEWAAAVLGYQFGLDGITVNFCKSLVHVLDMPRLQLAVFRHARHRTPYFESQFRIRHKDRSWKWVAVRGKIIERDASGIPVKMIGSIVLHARPAGEP